MINLKRARELRKLIVKAAISLNDEDALSGVELFPEWESNKRYEAGDRCRYKMVLYRCIQAHTSQDDWMPDITPALWVVVSLDEWPEWVQPISAETAYRLGAKVSHNGKHWINTGRDYNDFEPGVWGWDEVTDNA